jgi:hypothetical protein
VDVPEFAPEPETKQDARLGKKQASEGFAFTTDGDIGESATVETARDNLTKKIPELEEYEKKHFIESETNVTWEAYDVRAKKKVKIQNPRAVKMKNGKWAVKGTSPITGVKVCRFVGNKKPTISSEKTAESPKAESTAPAEKTAESPKAESTAPAEKTAESPKAEKEVVSRYYRSPEAESQKVKKSESNKCTKCGSKITTKDLFCTNCGAKR